ncbi:MAG TPA: hypothetical protein VFE42_21725, partial [Chloroflexota bacterium]|nr:hypothetical protein [Chloroflexota bacterium]
MSVLNRRGRARATAVRAVLAAALMAAGYVAIPATAGIHTNLASSAKPDSAVDLANTGHETAATGPAVTPSLVFNAALPNTQGGTAYGINLA